MTERTKVPARALQPGDVALGSGETIISVSAGVRTPRGKVDVTLRKGDRRRTAQWGAAIIIAIDRPAHQLALPGTEPDPAGLAQRLANGPMRPAKPQVACDVGLFSDEAKQIDLADLLARGDRS